jgi:hypothetical protein
MSAELGCVLLSVLISRSFWLQIFFCNKRKLYTFLSLPSETKFSFRFQLSLGTESDGAPPAVIELSTVTVYVFIVKAANYLSTSHPFIQARYCTMQRLVSVQYTAFKAVQIKECTAIKSE